ncbi:MAG: Rho termination factor N-terminal domain-containing protein [Solirubrobacteraceae bacterium]
MSVMDRSALEASPLADLHAIASELSIDGYRRLRRAELIDAILDKQAGVEPAPDESEPAPGESDQAPETDEEASAPDEDAGEPDDDDEERAPRRRRGRRGGRGRNASRSERSESEEDDGDQDDEGESGDEPLVEGVVELLANGSGFVRVQPPDASDDDVYISSAQVKRCELVSGDRITGPKFIYIHIIRKLRAVRWKGRHGSL